MNLVYTNSLKTLITLLQTSWCTVCAVDTNLVFLSLRTMYSYIGHCGAVCTASIRAYTTSLAIKYSPAKLGLSQNDVNG